MDVQQVHYRVNRNPPSPLLNAQQAASFSAPGYLYGLDYLEHVDQLLVNQQVELVEALTGFETSNKYIVRNAVGQPVFYAAEHSDWLTRNLCGSSRPFKMSILDSFGNTVMLLDRPLRCSSSFCSCCYLQLLRVYSPPGTLIGTVKQIWSPFRPYFEISDADDHVVLRIIGPFCMCRCWGDVTFNVFSLDGQTKVGFIRKVWSGLLREAFTDADDFSVTFPLDLEVKVKALLFAATFLIDFLYYENNQGCGGRNEQR